MNSRRFEGLDGLRGIAALIVVVCHTGLIFQTWAGGPEQSMKDQGEPWATAIQQSPLRLFFAGGEAVFVFFILSGFVLMLPFLREHKTSWIGYYPKRLLRLYLPILGAVALSAVVLFLVPRTASPDQTWWVNAHEVSATPKGLIREAIVLLGTGRYNSVLWSLKWEIIFSLLLPVYVIAAVMLRRWWLTAAVAMVAVSAVGHSLNNGYLEFLPMFGIGAFLAVGKEQIFSTAARVPLGAASMVSAGVLFSSVWTLPGLPLPRLFILTACAALIIGFMVWRPAIRMSRGTTVHWLGSRSFSLYLVHEPIIVSAALIFPGTPWLAAMVAWPAAFLCAEVFFRAVEDPSRRLANIVGRAANGLTTASLRPPSDRSPIAEPPQRQL